MGIGMCLVKEPGPYRARLNVGAFAKHMLIQLCEIEARGYLENTLQN